MTAPPTRTRITFAVFAGIVAALVTLGVFVGLPARWAPVDVPAALVAAGEIAACVALVRWRPSSPKIVRAASALSLAIGLVATALLAWTAAYLFGVYGPIGKGGAVLYLFVLALVVPYLIALPAARLVWTNPRNDTESRRDPQSAESKRDAESKDALRPSPRERESRDDESKPAEPTAPKASAPPGEPAPSS
jgi:hypothetical protein